MYNVHNWFTRITGLDYDSFWSFITNKLFGPQGAQIVAWICLILATYLIFARRVRAAGLIITLYIVAAVFAYLPTILKYLR